MQATPWVSPGAYFALDAAEFSGPLNVLQADGAEASCQQGNTLHRGGWKEFNFGALSGVIAGIEVRVVGRDSYGDGDWYLEGQVIADASDPGTATWSETRRLPPMGPFLNNDNTVTHTCGAANDLWGLAWAPGALSPADFAVALACLADSYPHEIRLDHVQARVWYTPDGPTGEPVFLDGPRVINLTADGFDIEVVTDQDAAVYSVVTGDGAFTPDSAQVYSGASNNGYIYQAYTCPRWGINAAVLAGQLTQITLSGTLAAGTDYDCYAVAMNTDSLLQAQPTLVDATTSGTTTPFVSARAMVTGSAFAILGATIVSGEPEPAPVLTTDATRVTRAHTATRVTRQ